jgi:hypothetical protein
VRQKLPESAGYPLMAGPPVGKTIYPGEEFDADRLVPGCVSLEPPESAPEDGEGETPPEGDADGETPPEQPGEAGDSKPAAKSRASGRGARP